MISVKSSLTFIACLFLMPLGACAQTQWTPLLDEDLSQWDIYLSYRHQYGYDGSMPTDSAGNDIAPIGLNTGNEEMGVFTSIIKDGEPVLRVSGEAYGAVISKKEYRNYRLKLKVKWGDKVWPPREKLLKDSGILYHSIGPMGADHWRSWMLSQEFQIMQGHMGDFWNQANSAIDIRAYIPEYIMNPVADESQDWISVGEGQDIQGFVLRKENHENPHGQWNELELICHEGRSLHIVNGHVVMALQNSRYIENGEAINLYEGKIQLQSEAAELFYKDIEILEIDDMPAEYVSIFE